jgi:hypothetical protein
VTPIILGAALIGAAGLCLVVVCWTTRTVLGGLLGATGIGLAAFAAASSAKGGYGKAALILALVLLIIGVVLYRLGQAFERLLDDAPEEEDSTSLRPPPNPARRRGSRPPHRCHEP